MGPERRADGLGFGLPRQVRITAGGEIRTLFRRGKRRRTRHLDVFVSASPAAFPRLALVVPKPRAGRRGAALPGAAVQRSGPVHGAAVQRSGPVHGAAVQRSGPVHGAAVQRNRLKRRLRELGRTVLLPRLRAAGRPLDVLIRARPEAYDADFAELKEQIEQLGEALCSPKS